MLHQKLAALPLSSRFGPTHYPPRSSLSRCGRNVWFVQRETTPNVQHRPGCRQQAAGSIGTSRLVRSEAARSWLLTGGSSLETLVFLTCRLGARNEKATGGRIFKRRACQINLLTDFRT